MSIIVQKFGGTSVADSQRILAAARKAIRAQQKGHQVVMVVSAMGKNTDMLVGLAHEINDQPPAREMDMLLSTGEQVSVALMAMAIDSLGHKAVSLTGGQIGIQTDSSHTKARIQSISTERLKRLLDDGNIVIAAGFQGIDENLDITTLGRGGSDTTAVALAAVLGAEACEIFTDVDGVYTTDPRLLPEARRVNQVSYDEMLELASLGAGVMHSRSIEFAKKFRVPIHVRSSMTDGDGSLIFDQSESDQAPVFGAALTRDEARLTLLDFPYQTSLMQQLFAAIAQEKITVDMIVMNVTDEERGVLSFTVPEPELDSTLNAIRSILERCGARAGDIDRQVAKISVVGDGMSRQVGVARQMFDALADASIPIQLITTSEIKISVLVPKQHSQQALRVVHQCFELDKPKSQERRQFNPDQRETDAIAVVDRLREVGIEGLVIDKVDIDLSQASVTVEGVPGEAAAIARLFKRIAEGGVFVDMIVESYSNPGRSDVTFTVPRDKLEKAESTAQQFSSDSGAGRIRTHQSIAKLSVSGIGLRSHTSVAVRSFEALADAEIPVLMISTSEVRLNLVVPGEKGKAAAEALQNAFETSMI